MPSSKRITENPSYTEEHVRSLDWREHIRARPGMYIGKLGDGSQEDDGIYLLFKEILDNSIIELVSASIIDSWSLQFLNC